MTRQGRPRRARRQTQLTASQLNKVPAIRSRGLSIALLYPIALGAHSFAGVMGMVAAAIPVVGLEGWASVMTGDARVSVSSIRGERGSNPFCDGASSKCGARPTDRNANVAEQFWRLGAASLGGSWKPWWSAHDRLKVRGDNKR